MSKAPGARRGQPSAFTAAQNEQLRRELVSMRSREGMSQEALGVILGVNQQNAGRLLKSAGFSYLSATRLVRFLGYAGVDTFFKSRGVGLPPSTKKSA